LILAREGIKKPALKAGFFYAPEIGAEQ